MSEITLLEAQLPNDKVGIRLRRAREEAGLSRAQVAGNTRIPERHLLAIEEGNFAALPARAYAMGFSRSYARAVGLNESEIASDVRDELDGIEHIRDPRAIPTFEPGDPARVPSARLALIATLAALIVVAAGTVLWRSYYAPAVALPPVTQSELAAQPISEPAPSPAPAVLTAGGQPALAPAANAPLVGIPTQGPAASNPSQTTASTANRQRIVTASTHQAVTPKPTIAEPGRAAPVPSPSPANMAAGVAPAPAPAAPASSGTP